jgi:dTDP-4-dehydrorhamnose 3,5-epimerase
MILRTNFKDLLIFRNKKYQDCRGYFMEIFRNKNLKKKFPFVVGSFSKKNVLRGLHLQVKKPQGKYITVIKGKILDVCVDLRTNSKTFGKNFSIVLSDKNSKSLYVPAGFAHGFFTLAKENYVIYSCTEYREAKNELGILYSDKELNIKWPKKKMIISSKDKDNISLQEYKKKYL